MRKSIALKTLLRSPLKTLLTFLLIAAASFAFFSRVTDYAVTTRETENAKSLYHATASLSNYVPDIPVVVANVDSPDKTVGRCYDTYLEGEAKPDPTREEWKEFASLPGATIYKGYMTAGRVEDYQRMEVIGEFGGFVVFEGTYEGYEENDSILENHICLKFDDVKVIACEGGPEIEDSFTTEAVPLGEMYYAKSSYTRAFYDGLKKGSRCLVLANNSGYSADGSSGIYFSPHETGDGSLCVIDGQPDNYLETDSFALQKGWVDAINYNKYVYDITYTPDMRAIPSFNEQKLVISAGRLLTAEDTEACVVKDEFLKEHGLSIGDRIHVQLGDQSGETRAYSETENWRTILDAKKIAQYVDSAELVIVGSYTEGRGDSVYPWSPNEIYVPTSLLPVKTSDIYESGFGLFVEDANDIEKFHEAAQQFADKVGLALDYSDRGWLDVKDSFEMGAFTSLLTTILYIAGAALALFLAVYLYIGRNKKTYAIMRMLGVPARTAEYSVVMPFVAVSVLAVPFGGITGFCYAQDTAKKAILRMADSAPKGYIADTKIPISAVILCLITELLFVSLTAYFFLWNMKHTPPLELLQEGAKQGAMIKSLPVNRDGSEADPVPVKFDVSKFTAAGEWAVKRNYGSVRHVTAYIWRHMRRGVGKTAVSLILASVLAAGIGMFVLARITYRNAFYDLGVKGTAVDFTFTTSVDLSKSPLVKDFYCQDSFGVWVQDTGIDAPVTMMVSSDLERDLGNGCTVDYAEGFGLSNFEGTAQVCLLGKNLAEKFGISPGDEIGIMSDILYSILKNGEPGENEVSDGYKTYKVIGIAESDDSEVRDSIFTGIRSDLTKLFSMDFSMDHCEFTLADNEKIDELDSLLKKKMDESVMYGYPSYHLDTGGLDNIERIRGLVEALFPIAVAAAVVIGLIGPLLVILQSAQEAAFLRILGVTKKRVRCMLMFEQIILCLSGILLVAGGLALSNLGLFVESLRTLAFCFGLYLLACVCGTSVAAVQVTRRKALELLQVKE